MDDHIKCYDEFVANHDREHPTSRGLKMGNKKPAPTPIKSWFIVRCELMERLLKARLLIAHVKMQVNSSEPVKIRSRSISVIAGGPYVIGDYRKCYFPPPTKRKPQSF